ncbi:MAG: hypothetical protein OHK0057_34260 [Thermoflexibacter sp.]
METYHPIDCGFYDILEATATLKKYVKVQYYTDIHEFITTNAVIKSLTTERGEEFMVLATGEKIRLDRVVKIDAKYNPKYDGYQDFTCDC